MQEHYKRFKTLSRALLVTIVAFLGISFFNVNVTYATKSLDCPFTPQTGRIIVDFTARERIVSNIVDFPQFSYKTQNYSTAIPAGTYNVTLYGNDVGIDRRDQVAEPNERWFLILNSSGNEVVRTNPTDDLADGVTTPSVDLHDGIDRVDQTKQVNTNLVIAKAIDSVLGYHANYPDTSSANSLVPVCAEFDDVTPKPTPTPTPVPTATPTPTVTTTPSPSASVSPSPSPSVTPAATPTPTPTPVVTGGGGGYIILPTPTPTPTPPPSESHGGGRVLGAFTGPVQCIPNVQTASVGQQVVWTATGGDGNYEWYPMDVAVRGIGPTFVRVFDTAGKKDLLLKSTGQFAVCSVTITDTLNVAKPGLPNTGIGGSWLLPIHLFLLAFAFALLPLVIIVKRRQNLLN